MMNEDTSMMFLAKEGDSGKAFALLATIVVLGLAFHAYSFMVVKENDILSKYNIQEYSISFEESSLQDSDSVLIGDGGTETIQFSRDMINVNMSQMMAQITFTITYEETSGQLADPCDEVLVNIPPNGFVADWQNTANELSDSSDDCETMTLTVFVYPGYNGEAITEEGESKEYWETMWTNGTYGSGVLSLEISVDTNQPPGSILPGATDDNEEINVQWEVTLFEANIER
jgi:hypothetical protein